MTKAVTPFHVFTYLATDLTAYTVITTATLTAIYAAYRANHPSKLPLPPPSTTTTNPPPPTSTPPTPTTLTTTLAVLFPLLASLTLFLLYYYTTPTQTLLLPLTTLALLFSLSHTLTPLLLPIPPILHLPLKLLIIPLILITYLLTNNNILNNILAITLVIWSTTLLIIPSLKISIILLSGLFFYDIFWVFFSAKLFGKNVMVTVATKQSPNPLSTLFKNFPHVSKHLSLPVKLIFQGKFGVSILGLGDIMIPAVFLTFLLAVDLQSMATRFESGVIRTWKDGLFYKAVIGYMVGLYASFFFNILFNAPQPALLYIIPAMTLPVLFQSYLYGDFDRLWAGKLPAKDQDDETTEHLLARDSRDYNSSIP